MERALRFEEIYPYPPAKVWRVLTTREHLAAWLMPNDFEPRVGHKFRFTSKPMGGWDGIVNCEVLELIPERRLSITWTSNMIDTKVTFLLEPFDGGTELTLIHEHLPDEAARKSHEEGWRGLLDKLPIFLGDAEWSI